MFIRVHLPLDALLDLSGRLSRFARLAVFASLRLWLPFMRLVFGKAAFRIAPMKITSLLIAGVSAVIFVFSQVATVAAPKVKMQRVYESLAVERPISIVIPPDGTKRQFLVEQTGKIKNNAEQ